MRKWRSCRRWRDYAAHPLDLGIQLMMPQGAADILGYGFFLNVEVDQAISLVTQATIIEISVEREKCWSIQLMQ